jgi:Flp pilus assembly protein TadB
VNVNNRIRQFHRWLAVAFTLTVIVTFIALAQKEPLVWVSYVPLLPLALLEFTGLCLFVLPYLAKRRSRRSTGP